ncbi:MAG: hypothetical protein ACRDTS_25510 [Mycobacterium sp.]
MASRRMRFRRLAALADGALLIVGGITGLTNGNGLVLSTIGAGLAVVAGLAFLSLSARSRP